MRYTIEVTRTTVHKITVEVEAPDDDSAKDMARDQVRGGKTTGVVPPGSVWTCPDFPSYHAQILPRLV
jgi:hypothetical protein